MTTKILTPLSVLALTVVLGACSSSGSGTSTGGGSNPVTPAPQNPASNAVADLANFAMQGQRSGEADGTQRYARTSADGRAITARMVTDSAGLVRVQRTGEVAAYDVAGAPQINAATPDGVYTGRFETSYRMNDAAPVRELGGNMYVELDMASGQGFMDSIGGNSHNVIEVMGDLDYANGRLSSDEVVINVRDAQGAIMFDANGDAIAGGFGSMDGILVDNSQGAAIVGALEGRHSSGFTMEGGMVLRHDDQY